MIRDDWPDLEKQIRKMAGDVGIVAAAAYCDNDVTFQTIDRIVRGVTKRPHRATRRALARAVNTYSRSQMRTTARG